MTNPQAGDLQSKADPDARVGVSRSEGTTPVSGPAQLTGFARVPSRTEAGLERQVAALREELRKIDVKEAGARKRNEFSEIRLLQQHRQDLLEQLESTEKFLKRTRATRPG